MTNHYLQMLIILLKETLGHPVAHDKKYSKFRRRQKAWYILIRNTANFWDSPLDNIQRHQRPTQRRNQSRDATQRNDILKCVPESVTRLPNTDGDQNLENFGLHLGQYHRPFGLSVMPTQAKWNHSMGHWKRRLLSIPSRLFTFSCQRKYGYLSRVTDGWG